MKRFRGISIESAQWIRETFAAGRDKQDPNELIKSMADELGIDERRVRRVIRGETMKSVGGPIFRSVRRVGTRRSCTRCKLHLDDEEFAHLFEGSYNNKGVCHDCVREGEIFERKKNRTAELRRRHLERKHALEHELKHLRTAPLIEGLPDAERAQMHVEVMRARIAGRL